MWTEVDMKRVIPYSALELKTFALKNNVYSNPYFVIDDFLDAETLDEFDSYLQTYVTEGVDNTSPYHMISELKFSSAYCRSNKFDDIIHHQVMRINEKMFRAEIACVTQARYTVYGAGDQIPWHTDEYIFPTSEHSIHQFFQRKLTACLMLSKQEEYTGGEFSIMAIGHRPDASIHTMDIDRGAMVIFPAYVQHRVAPILSGQRRNVTYRFNGPQWT
jgi:predicted 2-oxoglutarate/Fe(II)-dependent dioxygenase YbiX